MRHRRVIIEVKCRSDTSYRVFEDRLRNLFEQDQKRPRRERRTAVKLYEQLVDEGYTGSYSPVCRFVKVLKVDGSELLHAYIPLHFKAGDAFSV